MDKTEINKRAVDADSAARFEAVLAILNSKKIALSDALLRMDLAKQHVLEAEKALIRTVEEAARAAGIDPEDPNKGRWVFDPATMSFHKVQDA